VPHDVITIGGLRLISCEAIRREFGITGPQVQTLMTEAHIPTRLVAGVPFVSLWRLEAGLCRWFGGEPSKLTIQGTYYAKLTRAGIRARLRKLAGRTGHRTKRTKKEKLPKSPPQAGSPA